MIWCSADGLREGGQGVVLDVGVVMVASQASLSEQSANRGLSRLCVHQWQPSVAWLLLWSREAG